LQTPEIAPVILRHNACLTKNPTSDYDNYHMPVGEKMKNTFVVAIMVAVLLLMVTSCNTTSGTQFNRTPGLAEGVLFAHPEGRQPILAILPFVGGAPGDGDAISHLFVANQDLQRSFTVVPRTAVLDALFAEHLFQLGGLTDSDTIAGIGRMLNADYVLSGNIRRLGATYLIIATVVNVETFELVAGYYRPFRNIEEVMGFMPSMSRVLANATIRQDAFASAAPSLAIMPFAQSIHAGIGEPEADTLAQILAIEILNTGSYVILPRTSTIRDALHELEFQLLGYTDDESMARLAIALNAELVLAGSAQRLGGLNMFSSNILNLRDGSLVQASPLRNFDGIADAVFIMEEISIFLTEPDRARAEARVAALQYDERRVAARLRLEEEARRQEELQRLQAAERRRQERRQATLAIRQSGSRNLVAASFGYTWDPRSTFQSYQNEHGVHIRREHQNDAFFISAGISLSPLPFTAVGLDFRGGFNGPTHSPPGREYTREPYFTVAPSAGIVIPLGRSLRAFGNAVLEMGAFAYWEGSLTPWASPGFNAGLEIGRAQSQSLNFVIKYHSSILSEATTHSVSAGISWRYF